MFVLPALALVAKPFASIVAMVMSLEVQVAAVVRSSVPPEPKVPVSMYCRVVGFLAVPRGNTDAGLGEIARVVASAAVTVKFELAPGVPAALAVMVVVPGATAVATPPESIVATAVFEEAQVTRDVPS